MPDSVVRAYGGRPIRFGPEYIIPKPLDSRVLLRVVPAVAAAAVKSGVARLPLPGQSAYVNRLETLLGPEREILRKIITRAQQVPPADSCCPRATTRSFCGPRTMPPGKISPARSCWATKPKSETWPTNCSSPWRASKSWTTSKARSTIPSWPNSLPPAAARGGRWPTPSGGCAAATSSGAMLVLEGLVDGQVHGIVRSYPEAIRPVLQVIPRRAGAAKGIGGVPDDHPRPDPGLFADTTVNIHPDAADLAEIALMTAEMGGIFPTFGRGLRCFPSPISAACGIRTPCGWRRRLTWPVGAARTMIIDGEMQADTAVVWEILNREFPFNRLAEGANVLIFPDLAAGNAAYKLLARLGGAKAVGPLLMGISKPFNVLQRGADMENVVNVMAITAAQAQDLAAVRGTAVVG